MLAAPAILSQGGCSAERFSAGPSACCHVAVCARCSHALPDCMVVDFRSSRKQFPHLFSFCNRRLIGGALLRHSLAALAAIGCYKLYNARLGNGFPARFCRQHMGGSAYCHAGGIHRISRICMRGAHLYYRLREPIYAGKYTYPIAQYDSGICILDCGRFGRISACSRAIPLSDNLAISNIYDELVSAYVWLPSILFPHAEQKLKREEALAQG